MTRIGLKRGTVKLVPHNPQWEKLFKDEERRIKEGFHDWVLKYHIKIEHIGSTAISKIDAKPIIDILIGVRSLEDTSWTQGPLEQLGYTFVPKASTRDKLFFALGNDAKRTHYVHVVKYRGDRWKNDLIFRDYLRSHPDIAKKYNKLKRELSKKYSENRELYTRSKEPFIELVLDKAREETKYPFS